MGKTAKPAEPQDDPAALHDAAALVDAAQRAAAGDEAAVAEVRKLLTDPVQFQAFGDLAVLARSKLLTDLVGHNPLLAQAVPTKLAALRREVAGLDPNPIESLLVERILTNWLHLHALETRRGAGADLGPAAAAGHERAVDGAHRRYMASLRALAAVRKLALPAIQVNLAHHQVNVGSAGAVAVPPDPRPATPADPSPSSPQRPRRHRG